MLFRLPLLLVLVQSSTSACPGACGKGARFCVSRLINPHAESDNKQSSRAQCLGRLHENFQKAHERDVKNGIFDREAPVIVRIFHGIFRIFSCFSVVLARLSLVF